MLPLLNILFQYLHILACPTCGHIPRSNPLVKAGLIAPELAEILLIPPGKSRKANTRRRITGARVLTSKYSQWLLSYIIHAYIIMYPLLQLGNIFFFM